MKKTHFKLLGFICLINLMALSACSDKKDDPETQITEETQPLPQKIEKTTKKAETTTKIEPKISKEKIENTIEKETQASEKKAEVINKQPVFTQEGYGDIRINAKITSVPAEIWRDPYEPNSCQTLVLKDKGDIFVMVVDNQIVRIVASNFSNLPESTGYTDKNELIRKTPIDYTKDMKFIKHLDNGLAIGSPTEDIFAKYGKENITVTPGQYAANIQKYLVRLDNEFAFIFRADENNIIQEIMVGRFPEIEYFEGCY